MVYSVSILTSTSTEVSMRMIGCSSMISALVVCDCGTDTCDFFSSRSLCQVSSALSVDVVLVDDERMEGWKDGLNECLKRQVVFSIRACSKLKIVVRFMINCRYCRFVHEVVFSTRDV